jgi:hypothetical protein
MNAAAYIGLEKHYNLKQLGIEFRPTSNRYWEYDRHTALHISYLDLDYFSLDDEVPQDDQWVELPNKAELVVKEDITIERMLEALNPDDEAWFVPNVRTDDGFYLFRWLFKNVMSEERLKKELAKILDDPALLELSKRISYPVFNEDTDEEIRFEIDVTPYGKWAFARIAAIEYNGSRFEHCLKKPSDTNVYKASSKNIELLKDNLIAFASSDSSSEWLAERIVYNFVVTPIPQVLINQEMALQLQAGWRTVYFVPKTLEAVAKFKVFETDYTIFME